MPPFGQVKLHYGVRPGAMNPLIDESIGYDRFSAIADRRSSQNSIDYGCLLCGMLLARRYSRYVPVAKLQSVTILFSNSTVGFLLLK